MNLQSQEINEIASALSKAQMEIKAPEKDKKANYGMYATLGSVITACKQALNKHGIAIIQPEIVMDGQLYVVTTLLHSSGQWLRSYMPVPIAGDQGKGNPLQQLGGKMTYIKRYSLSAMLAIDADEDDDANGRPQEDNIPKQMISEEAAFNLAELIGDTQEDIDYLTKILSHYKASKLTEIALSNYAAIERSVKARRQKNEG